MTMRRWFVWSVVGMIGAASSAWATMDNLKTYKQAYPDQAAKTSCKTCHQGPVGKKGDLNAYGLALQTYQAPANAKKLTVDDIKAVKVPGADAATKK